MQHSVTIDELLFLADTSLVLGHRNSEWTGHGPILEQDIAISNIALDQVGQARYFYQYAAELINQASPSATATEDTLAYLRDVPEYKNLLMVELPKGDWAFTTLRQFFFSAWQLPLFRQLEKAGDERLAAIAEKAGKEVRYHMRWSGEWVIRLGDGTEESRQRIQKALDQLWPYTGECFSQNPILDLDWEAIHTAWDSQVNLVFSEAGLSADLDALRRNSVWMQSGGRQGKHTEHLGFLLSELQFLQRAYPGCEW